MFKLTLRTTSFRIYRVACTAQTFTYCLGIVVVVLWLQLRPRQRWAICIAFILIIPIVTHPQTNSMLKFNHNAASAHKFRLYITYHIRHLCRNTLALMGPSHLHCHTNSLLSFQSIFDGCAVSVICIRSSSIFTLLPVQLCHTWRYILLLYASFNTPHPPPPLPASHAALTVQFSIREAGKCIVISHKSRIHYMLCNGIFSPE